MSDQKKNKPLPTAPSASRDNNPNIDDLLPSDLLSEDEIVVFAVKPSLWSILFVSFRTIVIASLIALAATFLGPVLHLGELARVIIQLAGLAILCRLGFAFLQWVSRVYVLTNKRIIRIRGVFTIDIFQCALAKLQNTFLTLTVPQRILRLGNIAFTTAGTGAVEAIWRHVADPLVIHKQLIRAMNNAALPLSPASTTTSPPSSPADNAP